MCKNSAEERDMIGGGVESRQAWAEDPAESDEERDIINSISLSFWKDQIKGWGFQFFSFPQDQFYII